MSCTNCKPTLPVPTCVDELTIGVIGVFNTPVIVMIRDITQNRTTYLPTTSGAAGAITVSVADITFAENHSYEISVLDDSTNPWTPLSFDNVNGDGIGDYCAMPRFERIFDSSGHIMNFASYSLTMLQP